MVGHCVGWDTNAMPAIIGLGLFGLILNYKKQIIKFIGDIIYIRYYQETNLANKLLVIGFLRGIFGFKLFYYIDL